MFTNILLIVLGAFFAGMMFYLFFITLFSKTDYKNIKKPNDKKSSGIPDNKLKGKFIGRT